MSEGYQTEKKRNEDRGFLRVLLHDIDILRELTYESNRLELVRFAVEKYRGSRERGAFVSIECQPPTWMNIEVLMASESFPFEAIRALHEYDPSNEMIVLFHPWEWTPVCGHWISYVAVETGKEDIFEDAVKLIPGDIVGDERVSYQLSHPRLVDDDKQVALGLDRMFSLGGGPPTIERWRFVYDLAVTTAQRINPNGEPKEFEPLRLLTRDELALPTGKDELAR